MRPKLVLPLAGLLLLACIGFYATSDGKTPATTPAATEEGLAVYFSPKGGCTEAVVDALGKAKQTVLVHPCARTSLGKSNRLAVICIRIAGHDSQARGQGQQGGVPRVIG